MTDTPTPAAPVYTPETPDALRDGLLRGWHAHQRPVQPA
jgi:hypothetical protein